jgi:hypothetical protein
LVEVSASCPLLATPEQAWELICDTHRYAEWVVGRDAVTRADGRAREGATYDEANTILGPWKARTTRRVIEFSAPHRQVHTSTDLPLGERFDVVMEIEPEGDESLFRVTLRAKPDFRPAGLLFAGLMRPRVARDNRKTVAALAGLVRREHPVQTFA